MRFTTSLAAAILATLPMASAFPQLLSNDDREFCQSEASESLLALHEKILNEEQGVMDKIAKGEEKIQQALAEGLSGIAGRSLPGMEVTRRDTGDLVTLDAWFHVVHSGNITANGYISKEVLQKQFDVLNKAYEPSNLGFKLVGTDYYQNATWANEPDKYEKELKTALHKGNMRTLNIYFVPGLGNGGVCRFPNMNAYGDEALSLDGCMVGSFSVPGSKGVYNMGFTAVHEVGHWFGLLHTFEGGCDDKKGDYIKDTPAEATANVGKCPKGRDTCPDLPGLDPIENYMDYSADSCYNTFTPGQTARMRSMLALVRLDLD